MRTLPCHCYHGRNRSALRSLEKVRIYEDILFFIFTLFHCREAKLHRQPKNVGEKVKDFGEIISAKCNKNGNRISAIIANSNLVPDPKLYVFDLENDTFTYFNFKTGKPEEEDNLEETPPPTSADSQESREVMHQDRYL